MSDLFHWLVASMIVVAPPILRTRPFIGLNKYEQRCLDRVFEMRSTAPFTSLRVAPAARCEAAHGRVTRLNGSVLAVSLISALVLNLTALGVFALVTTGWHSLPANESQLSWMFLTPNDPSAEAVTTVAADDRSPGTQPMRPAGHSDRSQASNAEHRAALPRPRALQSPPAPATTGGEPTMRFYAFAEVDQPAEPDSDWNLNLAELDSLGVQSMVFDIFISRTGEIVDCHIVEPQALLDETRTLLENRLRQTVVQPALRHEIAVASVRRIEVSVTAQGS